MCQPENLSELCPLGGPPVYITDFKCTGTNEQRIQDSRYSSTKNWLYNECLRDSLLKHFHSLSFSELDCHFHLVTLPFPATRCCIWHFMSNVEWTGLALSYSGRLSRSQHWCLRGTQAFRELLTTNTIGLIYILFGSRKKTSSWT